MKYLILALILTGCVENNINSARKVPDGIGRFHDTDTNVVCYYYYDQSISCVVLK